MEPMPILASVTPQATPEVRQSIMTRRLRLGYVITNGISSIGELITGIASGDVARAMDGMHGASEILIGNTQMKDAHEHDHVQDSRRRKIYTALSSLSLLGAGVAMGDLAGAWDVGIDSLPLDVAGLGFSAVSAGSGIAAASIIVHRMRSKYGAIFSGRHLRNEIAPTDKDVVKHIVLLDTPSSSLAFLSGAARVASYWASAKTGFADSLSLAESTIGVMSGMWGAYLFRPTEKNLEHHHGQHAHETLPEAVENLVNLSGKQDIPITLHVGSTVQEQFEKRES